MDCREVETLLTFDGGAINKWRDQGCQVHLRSVRCDAADFTGAGWPHEIEKTTDNLGENCRGLCSRGIFKLPRCCMIAVTLPPRRGLSSYVELFMNGVVRKNGEGK